MALEAAQMGIWDWHPSNGVLHCSRTGSPRCMAGLGGMERPVERVHTGYNRSSTGCELRHSFVATAGGGNPHYRLAYSLRATKAATLAGSDRLPAPRTLTAVSNEWSAR